MIQRADTIGVFQIESRAQMSMLPRLKPASFYDLVIEVAIVRPGPIQGDMVHPYLRRRQGLEDVVYPSKELEAVLMKTLGVPLFQEQAMKIAIVAAGFTPAEADKLRRAMATFRRVGTIQTFQDKMIEGMASEGLRARLRRALLPPDRGFWRIRLSREPCGELRAARLRLLLDEVPLSGRVRRRDAQFPAARLLRAGAARARRARARRRSARRRRQPVGLGLWAGRTPLSRTRERGRGSRGRATCPHLVAFGDTFSREREKGSIHPRHAAMAEHIRATHAVRLGFRQILGAKEEDMRKLVERRGEGYDSVRDLWLQERPLVRRARKARRRRRLPLARPRPARGALGGARARPGRRPGRAAPVRRLKRPERDAEPDAKLPPMPLGAHVVEDYRRLSLSLKAHPTSFMRTRLAARGVLRSDALPSVKSGERVTVAGLVLVRQRPGTAKGVIFMTLEDEGGVANVIVWPKAFERLRAIVLGARFVAVTGKLQNEQNVIHVVADRMEDLTPMLGLLSEAGATIDPSARADEVRRPPATAQKRQGNRFAQTPAPRRPARPADPAARHDRSPQGDAGRAEFSVSRTYGLTARGCVTDRSNRSRSAPGRHVYRAAASCVRRQRTQKKILRQRIVEVVGDVCDQGIKPALALEFFDRLETQTLRRPMRGHVENRDAVAGDDDRLPALDLARQLTQAILRFLYADGLHARIVAASGEKPPADRSPARRRRAG